MNFNLIEKNPIDFLKNSTQEEIETLLLKCSDYYYNSEEGKILLSDQVFDIIKDYLEKEYSTSNYLQEIGSNIKSSKVKLPIHMGSMNKKKTEKEITKWQKNYEGNVVISDKLDGISFLLVNKEGKINIYTRGNGKEGKDITDLKDFVKLPKLKENVIVRGEILVNKENFKKVSKDFKNPRSFIAGMTNQKDFSKKKDLLKFVDLVVYELVEPIKNPLEQFIYLSNLGFKTVFNEMKSEFDFSYLKELMLKRKNDSNYQIDGLIITQNNINDRNKDGNPKYSFAFKMDLDFAITKVINVEWNKSKHGKLKPIVNIEPTLLCGTTNRKATGNNADFIVKNGIGPGAIVKMIKGGEIIPKIVEVLEKTEPQLPELEYVWNETHKEIILVNLEDDDEVKLKKIITFFKSLEVENIGPGIYKKIYNSGFNTIKKILNIKKEDLLKLDGIKDKSSTKIFTSLHKVIDNELDIENIISGSCILGTGLGYKILKKITSVYPDIFINVEEITTEMLNKIPSIQEKTSIKIINKLPEIRLFIKNHPELKIKIIENTLNEEINQVLKKNVVVTGKRDEKVKEIIEKYDWTIQNTVNKKTDILIVDDLKSLSSKMKKAKELKIDIKTNKDIINEYL